MGSVAEPPPRARTAADLLCFLSRFVDGVGCLSVHSEDTERDAFLWHPGLLWFFSCFSMACFIFLLRLIFALAFCFPVRSLSFSYCVLYCCFIELMRASLA